jgi:methylmalonyl-CoA/ethylmalonyl-CoA epimerase
MRNMIRGVLLFAAGLMAGHYLLRPAVALDDRLTGLHLNHIGIAARDWNQTFEFYTKTLGLPEAFPVKGRDGAVSAVYVQISHDNFLEISRADADHPAGLHHIGVEVDDINATIARLRARGFNVTATRSGATKAVLTSIPDPNGIRIEFLEYPPDSLQKQAMEAWR